MNGLEGRESK